MFGNSTVLTPFPHFGNRTLPGSIRRDGGNNNTNDRTVDTVLIPFIRSRKIYFKAEGLLPNLKHRALFDDVDVSVWCNPEPFKYVSDDNTVLSDTGVNTNNLTGHPDNTTNASLVTDANGVLTGSFYIPNDPNILQFRTGRREFKLRDWNATTDDNSISKGFAAYTAQGTLENITVTVTTSPPPARPPNNHWRDPIAQSFIVEKKTGAFVTSIDLFFATKDSTVPIQIQIRELKNGLPTNVNIPGAIAYLSPAAINISLTPDINNSATITNFKFPAPVYLEGFKEYAIVVISESDNYNVWVGTTGNFVVGSSNNRIMKQPALGSLFKSQNGSTWTPDQTSDLMFRINRAQFVSSGTAYLENTNTNLNLLQNNPLEVLNIQLTPIVRVLHPNHGLFPGSKVTLVGAIDTNGILANFINAQHTVVNASDIDYYTIAISGATSTALGSGGGNNIVSTQNMQFDILYPVVNTLSLSDTNISWSSKFTSGKSLAGIETPYIKDALYKPVVVNSNNIMKNPKVVASAENEISNIKTLSFKVDFSTTNDYLSPIVDLSRLSANLINYRIDNQTNTPTVGKNVPEFYTPEINSVDGSSISKHIFKPITITEAAISLKIIMSVNRPSDSNVDIYYRTIPAGSDIKLSDKNWSLGNIDNIISTDNDITIFRDYEYTLDNLESFNTFQIKIVFRSSNSAHVPVIRDFRAIALST